MKKRELPRSFDALLDSSDLPVLVDFWAEWCGACRMVSPAIEKIASEFKGRLLTVKVNVDRKPHIASRYQISSIPTIMMFDKGRSIMRLNGALPYEALRQEIVQRLS